MNKFAPLKVSPVKLRKKIFVNSKSSKTESMLLLFDIYYK